MPLEPLNEGHKRWPPWLNPLDGHTAELPSGIRVGQLAQAVYNHLVNWRNQGPCLYVPHQTSTTAKNDATGTYYIITHQPENDGGQDRYMALFYGKHGYPVAAAYALDWADPNDAGNDRTIEADTATSTTYPAEVSDHATLVQYAETPNAHGFDYCTLDTTNMVLAYLTAAHTPRQIVIPAQLIPTAGDVGPDEVIAYLDKSMRGLIEQMYDENDLVTSETCERLTRRCFFNWATSGYNRGNNVAAFTNIFGEMTFPCECRDLLDTQGTRYCYPAAVISVQGVAAGGGSTVELRFRSLVTGNSWTYTVQAGDPNATPFLVHYSRTGASDASGIKIVVENDAVFTVGDEIVVEGRATGAGGFLDVHAAGLWEGPV